MWLYFAALAVIGLIVTVLAGRWGGAQPSAEEAPGSPDGLEEVLAHAASEDRELTAQDLDAVQLQTGFRGYRMDQVDRLLDVLRDQLAEARAQERDTSGV